MKPIRPWRGLGALLAGLMPLAAGAASTTLSWKVAEEAKVYGYIVYRSDHRDGPFQRLNRQIVRVKDAERDDAGQSRYRYVDAQVESGKTYYYFIDAISVQGRKQRLSGVKSRTIP